MGTENSLEPPEGGGRKTLSPETHNMGLLRTQSMSLGPTRRFCSCLRTWDLSAPSPPHRERRASPLPLSHQGYCSCSTACWSMMPLLL